MDPLKELYKIENQYERFLKAISYARRIPDTEAFLTVRIMVDSNTSDLIVSHNTYNRPIKQTLVDSYAKELERGEWAMNGEVLIVSTEGIILDGQHRLLAIFQASIENEHIVQPLDFRFGVSKGVAHTIDIGAVKSTGCHLGMVYKDRGIKNATSVAAMLAYLYRYELHEESGLFANAKKPSTTRAIEMYDEYEDVIKEAVALSKKKEMRTLLAPSLSGALYVLFRLKNKRKSDVFFDSLMEWENLKDGNPIKTLGKKLTIASSSIVHKGYSLKYKCIWTITAWNHFVSESSLVKIDDGEPGDEMPEIDDGNKK